MPFNGPVQQGNTTRNLQFVLILSSDHITGATGKAPACKISKNGAAGVTPSGAITEVDAVNLPGWYEIAANPTDASALGPMSLHAAATACDPADYVLTDVVAYNPDDAAALGLSRIDAAVSSRLASASIMLAAGAVTVGTNNDKTAYGLAANAVDTSQFTQGAADKVWTSAARTLTAFAQSFADQVWVSATRTLTSVGVADIATAVWANVTRTLTLTAAQLAAAISGTNIVVQRGDTLSVSFTGLGSLVGRTKLWFTVKRAPSDTDPQAIIQIEESDGLLFLNGAPATSGQGSLTVTNATTGALTIALAAVATATLPGSGSATYDVQVDIAGTVTTLTQGSLTVNVDVTRATS